MVSWIRFQEHTLSEELEEWNHVADKAEEVKLKRAEVSELSGYSEDHVVVLSPIDCTVIAKMIQIDPKKMK